MIVPASETTGTEFRTWQELIDATAKELQPLNSPPSAAEYQQAETTVFKRAQEQPFPDDHSLLSAGKPVLIRSRLLALAPEMDEASGLIRVGGRLRRLEGRADVSLHPIVLDPSHPVTRDQIG